MRRSALILAASAVLLAGLPAHAAEGEKTYRSDHAVVTYAGITEVYAAALAKTVEAARAAAVAQYGFDMPDTIALRVESGAKRPRLFTDGHDRMFLSIRSPRDLRQPRVSRIFNLYGLCHEVGHMAMYRPIRERGWMTTAAAEGWAHWLGSRLVDAVYAQCGPNLWPDRYDYRADGMARLKRQVGGGRLSPTVKGARQWMKLAAIIGDKGFTPLFAAWGKAEVAPDDPAAALRRTLLATHKDKRLAGWWNESEALLAMRRPKSRFAARTAKAAELTGQQVELAHDDGKPAGKRSMAGGGHAVRFETRGQGCYLTAVRVHGGRYGHPRPPRENFHVWLCDAEFKQIADFPFPYARFVRGPSRWVTLTVTPTEVPPKFIVCVGFNPTATKGVYLSHDAEPGGKSLNGLPGRGHAACRRGDWLIRASVDRLKSADPLRSSN